MLRRSNLLVAIRKANSILAPYVPPINKMICNLIDAAKGGTYGARHLSSDSCYKQDTPMEYLMIAPGKYNYNNL